MPRPARPAATPFIPGYGFLSENADFARACAAASLTFIGPPADVIAAMGSKIEAKRRMQQAGVPLLPTVETAGRSAAEVLRQVESLSWPVLVKASAGGGGAACASSRSAKEFAGLFDTARQEAQTAFGDGTLFVEPYIETARARRGANLRRLRTATSRTCSSENAPSSGGIRRSSKKHLRRRSTTRCEPP